MSHCCAGQLRLVLNNGATPKTPRKTPRPPAHCCAGSPPESQGPRRAARRGQNAGGFRGVAPGILPAHCKKPKHRPTGRPQAHSFRPHGRPWLSWVNYSRFKPLRFKPSFQHPRLSARTMPTKCPTARPAGRREATESPGKPWRPVVGAVDAGNLFRSTRGPGGQPAGDSGG